MAFSELLAALPHARRLTPGDPTITRVVCDSRQVRPGDLFVAVPGAVADGHRFVADAVAHGAAAVVVERADAAPQAAAAAAVDDARDAVARLAHLVAGNPADKLTVCGITGTNGKTTTSYLMRGILQAAGRRVGLLGTISYQLGDRELPAATTTPGPVELAECFAELVRQGCNTAVMEVSSHALDQRRTAGVDFRAAAFTNLTAEHYDYHKNLEGYRRAKQRLFEGLAPDAVAVLNRDDEASPWFSWATRARVIWYSAGQVADVRAGHIQTGLDGVRFRLHLGGESLKVSLPLLGRFNVCNAMAAAGMAMGLGIAGSTIVAGLESVKVVPGRLEPVRCGQPFAVLVDYAHTDDALKNSLEAVGSLTEGRVIVVFGCGGDRDRSKRPRMARVAEELADVVIVTNDNPRTEAPDAIADEVFTGFEAPRKVIRQLDRATAIAQAVRAAAPGDVVVIAGKGHETYQIVGTQRNDFDDRQVARQALAAARHASSAGGGPCD